MNSFFKVLSLINKIFFINYSNFNLVPSLINLYFIYIYFASIFVIAFVSISKDNLNRVYWIFDIFKKCLFNLTYVYINSLVNVFKLSKFTYNSKWIFSVKTNLLNTLIFYSNKFNLVLNTLFSRCKLIFSLIIGKYKNINCLLINKGFKNTNLSLFNLLTYLIVSLIFINLFLYIVYIYTKLNSLTNLEYILQNVIPDEIKKDTVLSDPVRWWPSGVPQGMSVVGTALATYLTLSKIKGVSPRVRVIGALASAGATTAQITYNSILENSVGFNRFMWGLTEYRRTNSWPSIDQVAKSTSEKQLNDFATEALKHADTTKVESTVNEVLGKKFISASNSDSDSNFSDLINNLIDLVFKETMQLFKHEYVQGYFDDLIGQRIAIELILFILCILTIILFIVFICNVIFLLNKDRIIKRFDNKFITLYVKYQSFLAWITILYIPIIILMSLLTLSHGLHWLITNQIPYESLGIDLHKYLSISDDTKI